MAATAAADPDPDPEDDTTWVVLAGAPTSEAAISTAAELVWLTRPSTGRMRKMRRPMVRTIRQPPRAVPRVRVAAQAMVAHTGADSDWMVPWASRTTASSPTAFWASLPPWLRASHPEVTHWALATGRLARVVSRRAPRRAPRSSSQAAPKPRAGERARAVSDPTTPVGWPPPTPPQLTAPTPASTTVAPTRPPTRAWLELDGSPSRQVVTFQDTAAVRAAPTTVAVWAGSTSAMLAMVLATAAPSSSGPTMLQTAARAMADPGRAPLVATRVAMALAASLKPLVNAKARMTATASTNVTSTRQPPGCRPLSRPARRWSPGRG
jgi:hypothetical protein